MVSPRLRATAPDHHLLSMNKTTRLGIAKALRQAAHTLQAYSGQRIDALVSYIQEKRSLAAPERRDLYELLKGLADESSDVEASLRKFEDAFDAREDDDTATDSALSDVLTNVFHEALQAIDRAVERQAELESEHVDRAGAEDWLQDGIAQFFAGEGEGALAAARHLRRRGYDEAADLVENAVREGASEEDIFGALESSSTASTDLSDIAILYANDMENEGDVRQDDEVIGDLTIKDVVRLYRKLDDLFDTESVERHATFDPSQNYHTYFYKLTVGWSVDTDGLRDALAGVLPEGEEETGPPEVVYKFKNGFQVVSLKPGHLAKEGCEGGICVGQRKHGYYDALKAGEIAIYSLRTPSDKVKLTIEVDLHEDGRPKKVLQVKGKANRLPGFDLGREEFKHVDEVEMAMEFVSRYLKLDPMDAPNLAPGVTALAEWKEQDAERRARQKAERAERRLQGSVSHPLSSNVLRLLARADRYDLRLERERS